MRVAFGSVLLAASFAVLSCSDEVAIDTRPGVTLKNEIPGGDGDITDDDSERPGYDPQIFDPFTPPPGATSLSLWNAIQQFLDDPVLAGRIVPVEPEVSFGQFPLNWVLLPPHGFIVPGQGVVTFRHHEPPGMTPAQRLQPRSRRVVTGDEPFSVCSPVPATEFLPPGCSTPYSPGDTIEFIIVMLETSSPSVIWSWGTWVYPDTLVPQAAHWPQLAVRGSARGESRVVCRDDAHAPGTDLHVQVRTLAGGGGTPPWTSVPGLYPLESIDLIEVDGWTCGLVRDRDGGATREFRARHILPDGTASDWVLLPEPEACDGPCPSWFFGPWHDGYGEPWAGPAPTSVTVDLLDLDHGDAEAGTVSERNYVLASRLMWGNWDQSAISFGPQCVPLSLTDAQFETRFPEGTFVLKVEGVVPGGGPDSVVLARQVEVAREMPVACLIETCDWSSFRAVPCERLSATHAEVPVPGVFSEFSTRVVEGVRLAALDGPEIELPDLFVNESIFDPTPRAGLDHGAASYLEETVQVWCANIPVIEGGVGVDWRWEVLLRYTAQITNGGRGPLYWSAPEDEDDHGHREAVQWLFRGSPFGSPASYSVPVAFAPVSSDAAPHPSHSHLHILRIVQGRLVFDAPSAERSWAGVKAGFCHYHEPFGRGRIPGWLFQVTVPSIGTRASCEGESQGIMPGFSDTYGLALDGQGISITSLLTDPPTGYEGGVDVPLRLEIVVDPDDSVAETNNSNNVATAHFSLPTLAPGETIEEWCGSDPESPGNARTVIPRPGAVYPEEIPLNCEIGGACSDDFAELTPSTCIDFVPCEEAGDRATVDISFPGDDYTVKLLCLEIEGDHNAWIVASDGGCTIPGWCCEGAEDCVDDEGPDGDDDDGDGLGNSEDPDCNPGAPWGDGG